MPRCELKWEIPINTISLPQLQAESRVGSIRMRVNPFILPLPIPLRKEFPQEKGGELKTGIRIEPG